MLAILRASAVVAQRVRISCVAIVLNWERGLREPRPLRRRCAIGRVQFTISIHRFAPRTKIVAQLLPRPPLEAQRNNRAPHLEADTHLARTHAPTTLHTHPPSSKAPPTCDVLSVYGSAWQCMRHSHSEHPSPLAPPLMLVPPSGERLTSCVCMPVCQGQGTAGERTRAASARAASPRPP